MDLSRHFLLVQAKSGLAKPELVIQSYQSPIQGRDLTKQIVEYGKFQVELQDLISDYVRHCEQKVKESVAEVPAARLEDLEEKKKDLDKRIKEITKKAFYFFDDKDMEKTLIMAIDEYMHNFLIQVHTGNRAYTTLEKWIGRSQKVP